jgi:drug/metabolite transporter (DMT)-like permease
MTEQPHRPLAGILLILLSVSIQPFMDAASKLLTAGYPTLEIVWGRYFFHVLLMLPVVLLRYGPSALRPPHLGVQLMRSTLLLGASITFVLALRTTPMADALALAFGHPIVTVIAAALLLKEAVGPRRWSAVGVGLIGVLMIVRPGGEELSWGAIAAFGSGIFYGLYSASTRHLASSSPPLVTLVFSGLVGAVAMTIALPFFWVTPTAADWGLMVATGALAALGHFLSIVAYQYAPASVLAPFGYAKIVNMTIVGYLVFGDLPDAWSWAGIAVLIGSGVYITLRERRVGVPAARPD